MAKKRKILLIEPGYKNKYPPIGLMKIATYHRMLGDDVVFYKGDVQEFIFNQILDDCIIKLDELYNTIDWKKKSDEITQYLKLGYSTKLKALLPKPDEENEDYEILKKQIPLIEIWLQHFSNYYKKKQYKCKGEARWDRVYITTLFTFYWNITIKAIKDSKCLVKNPKELKIGGILASLLADEVEGETEIKPITGILDRPGMLDPKIKKAQDIVIDDLPLDYSILDEIDYKYPTGSAYFTFMTKGCTRSCTFCSVPKLEPIYKEKVPTKDKFIEIKELYGEQQNLLLMDNNVLASPKFPEIIQDIKDMGFVKGARFIEPNQLDIAIKNLKKGHNDTAYIKKCYAILKAFIDKRVKGKNAQTVYNIYDEFKLLDFETVTKGNLISAYKQLKDIFEKYRYKLPKNRYVDFNQGIDARYVTNESMKLISEIPINPLRIAFDYWGIKKQYENAVRLAAKYKINRLSNYLLFNFKDKPEDLYNRMHINMQLSEELNIHIYSFPMKYIPLFGDDAKNRDFIGALWNKKFIRAIQSITNVTRGIVPPERSFFEKAFGRTEDEYFELLYMPETFIIYRKLFEVDLGLTGKWKQLYQSIKKDDKLWAETKIILENCDFTNLSNKTKNKNVLNLLEYYTISREDVNNSDKEYLKLKKKFDHLIKSDQFMDLTLTYDYEEREANYMVS